MKKQKKIAELRSEAKRAKTAHDWQRVIDCCQKIRNIHPGYLDLWWLQAEANLRLAPQWIRASWTCQKVGIGVVTLILCAVGLWFALSNPSPWTLPTTTLSSTSMPMPIGQIAFTMDGTPNIDTSHCWKIGSGSRHEIEAVVLDIEGAKLPFESFSYQWSFNPPDQHNLENLGSSRGHFIIYDVPPELGNQTVTVQILKEMKPVAVKSICFDITK